MEENLPSVDALKVIYIFFKAHNFLIYKAINQLISNVLHARLSFRVECWHIHIYFIISFTIYAREFYFAFMFYRFSFSLSSTGTSSIIKLFSCFAKISWTINEGGSWRFNDLIFSRSTIHYEFVNFLSHNQYFFSRSAYFSGKSKEEKHWCKKED